MKHVILTLMIIFLQHEGFGQNLEVLSSQPKIWEAQANTALGLQVDVNEREITFMTPADFRDNKTLPAYFQLQVTCPPGSHWVVTASVSEVFSQQNSGGGTNRLTNLIGIRVSPGQIIKLSEKPQTILQSDNNLLNNGSHSRKYSVDLIASPPFDMPAGSRMGVVNFRLELL